MRGQVIRIEFPVRGCLDRMLSTTMQEHDETVIVMRNLLTEMLEDYTTTYTDIRDTVKMNVAEAMLAGIRQNTEIVKKEKES